jgi:hypothetical protein
MASNPPAFPIRDSAEGAQFALKVQPRASRNAIAGVVGDALKLSLTAPPVDGKANQAVVEFFAALLKVPKYSIVILSGETSRNKRIAIRGMTAEAVRSALKI